MKLFKEFLYIISFTYMGEILSKVLHLPIPGSVIGMLLLFCALHYKIIHVNDVDMVGNFLLDNLSILFLPAGVGIMVYFPVIRNTWWSLLIITLIVTALTIGVVGKVVQGIKRKYENDTIELATEEDGENATHIDE